MINWWFPMESMRLALFHMTIRQPAWIYIELLLTPMERNQIMIQMYKYTMPMHRRCRTKPGPGPVLQTTLEPKHIIFPIMNVGSQDTYLQFQKRSGRNKDSKYRQYIVMILWLCVAFIQASLKFWTFPALSDHKQLQFYVRISVSINQGKQATPVTKRHRIV